MAGKENKTDVQISSQNISYYNEIAKNYDIILNNDNANLVIRKQVADKFKRVVKVGVVMDLGGGTGRDLEWLLLGGYHILFCEPSVAMRQIAIDFCKQNFQDPAIDFLENKQSDFRTWEIDLPFEQEVDAVLANFAVINCIPDIDLLFEKLAFVIRPGGNIIALLLDQRFIKRLRSNFKSTLRSVITSSPVCITIDYHGQQQIVTIHSMKALKKAISNKFDLHSYEYLHGFCLIHLIRK